MSATNSSRATRRTLLELPLEAIELVSPIASATRRLAYDEQPRCRVVHQQLDIQRAHPQELHRRFEENA